MEEQVAAYAFIVTIDLLARDDLFDLRNCRDVALGDELCVFTPEVFFDLRIPIVKRAHEMSCRTAGFTAADIAVFKNDHTLTGAQQAICSTEAGDPATY